VALMLRFLCSSVRSFVVQKFLQQFDSFDLFPRVLSFYHEPKCVLTLFCKTLILSLLPRQS
jgi:hypothetical protein